jgi:hypothetical protein
MLSVFKAGSGWYMVGVVEAEAKAAVTDAVKTTAASIARMTDVMGESPSGSQAKNQDGQA